MPRLKYFNDATQEWDYVVVGGQGPQGEAGPGISAGGTAGQIIAKVDGTDYNTEWIDNYTEQVKHTVKAGESLTKGQAVYVSSANGTNMIVSKASNSGESTSSKTMGLIAQTLANNDQGFVITEGLLAGLNTASATAGDPVWLGTSGNLIYGLSNKPTAPAHLVFIGIVTRVHATQGEIWVKVQNGFELDELHDVSISSPAAGEIVARNSGNTLWENMTLAEAGISAVGHTHDDRYYTESETDSLLSGKANTSHTHSASDITSGTLDVNRLPSGTIIQQVHYTYNTYTNGTSSGWTDIHSGTRPAITAKRSDSHFIILASMNWLQEGSRRQMIRLLRNGSVVAPSDVMIATSIGSGWTQAQMFYQWKDTSARTAGTTYTFSFDTAVTAGTWYYNYNYGGITGTSMYSILEIVA